jgi:hypothetical protein
VHSLRQKNTGFWLVNNFHSIQCGQLLCPYYLQPSSGFPILCVFGALTPYLAAQGGIIVHNADADTAFGRRDRRSDSRRASADDKNVKLIWDAAIHLF